MSAIEKVWNSPVAFWAILAGPALVMLAGFAGEYDLEELIEESGEFAARFMIAAMMLTPLRSAFARTRWIGWLAQRRRALGVAAFGYAALHLLVYLVDMQTLRNILAEFWALGIWTGWAAFAILLPLAITSNDALQRRLKANWRVLHRWVYPAAVLVLAHWMFVHNNMVAALVTFFPLAALEIYRVYKIIARQRKSSTA